MKHSIHSQRGILCQDCHGGDPLQPEIEKAKASNTNYRGIPDKKTSVQTCGQCHADVQFMNPYGIRTDQLARYKSSGHGHKLFESGDTKVAACIDCHGYHEVLSVSDPNSSAYPMNIPKTCTKCHGNERLMKNYGLPTDILETYAASVHGRALFEKKDLSAAHCASCHGSHGAVPPGVREIGATCGKCHVNEKKYFLESVHAPLVESGKFSECVSCHGNHGVQHPTPALYEESCSKCHVPGTPAFNRGQEIKSTITESIRLFEETHHKLKEAEIRGFFVEEEIASMENAKTNLIELSTVQHTLTEDSIAEFRDKITQITGDAMSAIEKKRKAIRSRKVTLALIWIFIIVMVWALWKKYHQLKSK